MRAERQDARRFGASLIRHVGGEPSPTQAALIDAATQLKLKLNVFDAHFIETGGMTPNARREYLAFVNSFSRLIRQLGLRSTPLRDGEDFASYLQRLNDNGDGRRHPHRARLLPDRRAP